MPSKLEELVSRAKTVPVDEIGSRIGVHFGESGFAICPFHQDSSPSLYYQDRVNRAKCYACNWSGDGIALVQGVLRKTFKEAISFILGRSASIEESLAKSGPSRKPDREISGWPPNEKTREIWDWFSRESRNPRNASLAWDYLETRGILREESIRYRIGGVSDPGRMLSDLMDAGFTEQSLLESGLVSHSKKTGRRYFNFFAPSTVFIHHEMGGEICGFSGRFLPPEPATHGRFIKLRGLPSFPWTTRFDSNREKGILVTEGVLDAISASILLGFRSAISPGGGTCVIGQELIQNASQKAGVKDFLIAADDDEAGINASILWKNEIMGNCPEAKVAVLSPRAYCDMHGLSSDGVKDWNDVLKKSRSPKPVYKPDLLPEYVPPGPKPGENSLDILARLLFPSSSPLRDEKELKSMLQGLDPEEITGSYYVSHHAAAIKMISDGESWASVASWIEGQLPLVKNLRSRRSLAWVALQRNLPLFGIRI
jgi:DNA primase